MNAPIPVVASIRLTADDLMALRLLRDALNRLLARTEMVGPHLLERRVLRDDREQT